MVVPPAPTSPMTGILYRPASSADVGPSDGEPEMPTAPWLTRCWNSWVSKVDEKASLYQMNWTLRPSRPPLALICCTASFAPSMVATPAAAYAPVVPARPPMMIGAEELDPDPELPPEDAHPAAVASTAAPASRPAVTRSLDRPRAARRLRLPAAR